MFTFLRKIRKSLIESSSARKPASPSGRYLLYAMGEIALVVIGILIALQINNWNQNSNHRAEERRILVDLKEEVVQAIDSKIQLREYYNAKLDTLAFALDKLFSEEIIDLSNSECLNVAMTHIMDWVPSSISTIEELIASGKINLIKSEELRRKIVLFRNSSQSIELRMNRTISEVNVLVDMYPDLIIRSWDKEIQWYTYSCDVLAMKNTRSFLAHLQSNRGRTGGLVRAADAIIKLLEEIKDIIE